MQAIVATNAVNGWRQMMDDETYMRLALAEADRAAALEEVPVGAVIVGADGQLIGAGHNLREQAQDPTAHAEMIALRAAGLMLRCNGFSPSVGSWRGRERQAKTRVEDKQKPPIRGAGKREAPEETLDPELEHRFADLLAEHCGVRIDTRARRKLALAV